MTDVRDNQQNPSSPQSEAGISGVNSHPVNGTGSHDISLRYETGFSSNPRFLNIEWNSGYLVQWLSWCLAHLCPILGVPRSGFWLQFLFYLPANGYPERQKGQLKYLGP